VVSALIASLLVNPDLTIEVDLASQRLTDPEGRSHAFDIDPFSKHCLLEGIDELDYTLAQMDRIEAFARQRAEEEGWAVPEGSGSR
jgi:3-isopropylmalate/(R)-2-methylmalate dehydratase small subunit